MTSEYLAVIVGMGVVTYVPRWFPLVFLTRRRLPLWLVEWLDFIPASILSALVVPYLITTGEPRHLDVLRPELFVAIPTFAFAVKTKSLAATVVVGMFLFWLAGMYLQ
ncbi:MAG: AzlD domain-containing protein [Deltaproteobacteria bacterium]|nr:AzlD domain-containing protein [Deltaproteobacteria bacterium]MBN2688954.1 AzlD domain-containing protein [Deltaproteobacteria bacterium]